MESTFWLYSVYFGNSVQDYLISIGIFIAGFCLFFVLEKILLFRLKRIAKETTGRLDDILLNLVNKSLVPLLYVAAFYMAAMRLEMNEAVKTWVYGFCVVALTIQVVRFLSGMLVLILRRGWEERKEGVPSSAASKGILIVVRSVVWGLGLVFMLDNLGYDISAVIAGLGIGGIAIAFAVQAILGDLFNYFVILFDEPFKEGDFIIIGDFLGEIEHVGIKSTRIRSLGGEQIVMSNTDLTSSRIRNYKRMDQRRVLFRLRVTYQTPYEKMQKIPMLIRQIIENIKDTRYDRAHFQGYGDFSLNFEIVYYVLTGDYNKYMDIQEQINLAILKRFEAEGIDFAYPTQTLFLEKPEGEAVRNGS